MQLPLQIPAALRIFLLHQQQQQQIPLKRSTRAVRGRKRRTTLCQCSKRAIRSSWRSKNSGDLMESNEQQSCRQASQLLSKTQKKEALAVLLKALLLGFISLLARRLSPTIPFHQYRRDIIRALHHTVHMLKAFCWGYAAFRHMQSVEAWITSFLGKRALQAVYMLSPYLIVFYTMGCFAKSFWELAIAQKFGCLQPEAMLWLPSLAIDETMPC